MSRTTALGEHHPFRSAQARTRFLSRYDELADASPVPWDVTTVESDHGRTLVRSTGPIDGPPLVLLAGVWCHSLQWPVSVIEAFSETYRVHAVDNIVDFGRSVSTRPVRETADFMSWLDAVLETLAPSSAVNLLGQSRGAFLAAEYALHDPDRLASVVWVSPGLVVFRLSMRNVANLPRSLAMIRRPSTRTVGAMMRWLMPESVALDEVGLGHYIEDTALGLECYDTSEVGRLGNPRVFTDAELGSIRVPALYLAGEDERLTPVRSAVSRLHKVAPQIKAVAVPGTGHGVVSEKPEEFSRQVLGFLDSAAVGVADDVTLTVQ